MYATHVWMRFTESLHQMRYCNSMLRSMDKANSKNSKGYDASGLFAIQCRHMLIMPSGVGDLFLGERYVEVKTEFCCLINISIGN